jgi:hypothetical protein
MLSYQQPKQLSLSALRQFVSKAIEKGWVRETFHAEHDRAYRNISNEDVLHGLERPDWSLAAPPNYSADHNNWQYKIKTLDVEGEELHLIVSPRSSDGTLRIITKY